MRRGLWRPEELVSFMDNDRQHGSIGMEGSGCADMTPQVAVEAFELAGSAQLP
jgi:hypothetical protein